MKKIIAIASLLASSFVAAQSLPGPANSGQTNGYVLGYSFNGDFLTPGTYTLTGAAAKTLTFNNSLTLAGTDATTMTFPTTSATIARTDAAQIFTGAQTIGSGSTGFIIEPVIGGGYAALYSTSVTPSAINYSLVTNSSTTILNGISTLILSVGGTTIETVPSSTGIVSFPYGESAKVFNDNSGNLLISSTAPTLSNGGCTGASMVKANNTAAFSASVGSSSCTGSEPLVFSMPAAPNSWSCDARDVTQGSYIVKQTGAISTTTVTITNYGITLGVASAWVANDVVEVKCIAY